jgi:hypothetical protein
MFGGEDLPYWEVQLGAQVIGLTYATTRSTGEFSDSGSEAPGEDRVVEGTSNRVIGGKARRGIVGEGFTFRVIDQGFVVALFP